LRLELVAMSSVFLVGVAVFTLGSVTVNVGMRTETSLHKLLKLEHVGPPFLMPKFDPKMVIVTAALNGADGAGLKTFVFVPIIMVIAGGEY
jgi:hypothetical protein